MEIIIRQLLKEYIDNSVKKISIFDFDGTLIDTPLPEVEKVNGKTVLTNAEWKSAKGYEWPHRGWWGVKDSLDMNAFKHPVIPEVIRDYQKEKNNPSTLLVMMTGRIKKLSDEVEKILGKYGLRFDLKLYNGSNGRNGKTDVVKIGHLNDMINSYPNVNEIEMWEDRAHHVKLFNDFGNSLDGINFKVNHV